MSSHRSLISFCLSTIAFGLLLSFGVPVFKEAIEDIAGKNKNAALVEYEKLRQMKILSCRRSTQTDQ